MTDDEQAFIREIAASPDAVLPRLIYADWLDEQGDPRGEYLRLECRAVQEPDQAAVLQQLARELLAEYRMAWVAALGEGVMFHNFRLGLIDDVVISAEVLLGNHGQVLLHAPLTGLGVRLSRQQVPAFCQIPNLYQLRRLRLGSSELGDGGVELLLAAPQLSQIQELWLSNCGIGSDGMRNLLASPLANRLRTVYGNPGLPARGRLV